MGLLEAIPEDEILANADPADEDGDGISGRPNMVWNLETGQTELGRFGWKANTPTAFQQAGEAYNQDMGITNPLVPNESCLGQTQCDGIDDGPEIDSDTLDNAAFYVETLAVPARREFDTESRHGEKLFDQAGCSSCHTPVHTTERTRRGASPRSITRRYSPIRTSFSTTWGTGSPTGDRISSRTGGNGGPRRSGA